MPPSVPRGALLRSKVLGTIVAVSIVLSVRVSSAGQAQQPPPPPPPPPLSGAKPPGPPPGQPPGPPPRLRVFLDCYECDDTYIRQNVEFIDYVREPAVADLHVLVTTQGTGGGGASWTAKFIGLGRLQGHDHTLTFTTPQTATGDDRRREFTKYFKLGLVAFATDTPVAPQLEVTWRRPAEAAAAKASRDPWNFWVFRVGVNGNFNGEQLSNSRSYRLNFSSNRTTEQWKLEFNANSSVNKNEFKFEGEEAIKSRTDQWSTGATIVKSLGPKWSVGARGSVSHSSFSNTDRSVGFSPGIEFDFFPYSEWSRRSLTVLYSAGPTSYKYRELTVYDKLSETVPSHSVSINLSLRQPWGSLNVYPNFTQHLNHPSRYRSSIWGSTDVRLFKGFSFNVFAEYNKIKDLISLRKGAATEEEVLLRLRQLQTDYSYYLGFGVSYSFGSIFNSVVNPRFGG
jgi:hypothetical protein